MVCVCVWVGVWVCVWVWVWVWMCAWAWVGGCLHPLFAFEILTINIHPSYLRYTHTHIHTHTHTPAG